MDSRLQEGWQVEKLREELLRKINNLSNSIWEQRIQEPHINEWLDNFEDTNEDATNKERLHALYLLSQFMYFGDRQIRELLKSLFRDLYQYPIIEQIRKANSDTTDLSFIDTRFDEELRKTRFLGIGNPSESGTHLLYYFRQENSLDKALFINAHEIFQRNSSRTSFELRDTTIERYVFIDDFSGSGTQAKEYSRDIVSEIKSINKDVRVSYYMLFSTKTGKEIVQTSTLFDDIEAIFELDMSYKCFGDRSRYFLNVDSSIDKTFAKDMCLRYGQRLLPSDPLGYKDSQLLIGFHHNVPDNTLPIIWYNKLFGAKWTPIFRRYPKIEV